MIRETVRATVRGVSVVVLTAVEVAALSVWLGLVVDARPLSAAVAVGVGALAAGLLVELLLTHVTANGWRGPVPGRAIAGLALAETLLWVGWLAAIRWIERPLGVVGVGLALAAALVVRHTVAHNALRGRDALASLVRRATVAPGVVEAAGVTTWFLVVSRAVQIPEWAFTTSVAGFSSEAVVGAALLACAVFVQHLLAVRHALRTTPKESRSGWQSSRGTLRE